MVNRSYSELKMKTVTANMNPSIQKVFQSVTEKVKDRPELESVWLMKFPTEKQFIDKLKQDDHGNLLLKAFEFIDEVIKERNVRKVHSLKSSMSLRKEKIANIYQQLSESIKNTKACASSIGYSRAGSTDFTLTDC